VIETAQASGLTLLSAHERNPMVATSYGTGQLVADAVRKGARHVIVALGGSATSDAGMGMLRALIDAFGSDGSLSGHSPYTPCLWDDVKELKHVSFTIASDVNNPLYGRNGAAYVFAPQKFAIQPEQTDLRLSHGAAHTQPQATVASPKLIEDLERRARKFAELSARHFGYDRSGMEGAGAAGGMGYAFLQYLNASYKPGIELLLEEIGFKEAVKDADLVITGEGSADRQTLMGKLPFGILQRAQRHDVPVMLIAGRIADEQILLDAGFSRVACINPLGLPLEIAMQPDTAKENIRKTVRI
jgi:glycerate kinase